MELWTFLQVNLIQVLEACFLAQKFILSACYRMFSLILSLIIRGCVNIFNAFLIFLEFRFVHYCCFPPSFVSSNCPFSEWCSVERHKLQSICLSHWRFNFFNSESYASYCQQTHAWKYCHVKTLEVSLQPYLDLLSNRFQFIMIMLFFAQITKAVLFF